MKKHNILTDLLKETPIETRLNVLNEMTFITLIRELGYREDKSWSPEEDDKLNIICQKAIELTKDILQEIKKWENDRKPE